MGEGVGGPRAGVGWGPWLPGSDGSDSQGRPDSEPGGGAGGDRDLCGLGIQASEGFAGGSWGEAGRGSLGKEPEAGYLLQLDEGKLHVCALGDLLFIPGRRGGWERDTHRERGGSDGCVESLGFG